MLYVSNKKYQLPFRLITSNLPYTDVGKKCKLQFSVSYLQDWSLWIMANEAKKNWGIISELTLPVDWYICIFYTD